MSVREDEATRRMNVDSRTKKGKDRHTKRRKHYPSTNNISRSKSEKATEMNFIVRFKLQCEVCLWIAER